MGSRHVEQIVFRRTRLEGEPFAQRAVATDERVAIPCGLILTSIGYRGRPLEGAPFDHERGIVPNEGGRAVVEGQSAVNLYVTGWLKRGPTGIIGTNRADSIETVQRLLDDVAALPRKGAELRRDHVEALAAHAVVNAEGWARLDAAERSEGARLSKPREKFVHVATMLDHLRAGSTSPAGTKEASETGPAAERRFETM